MTLSKDDIETLAAGAGKSPAALFAAVHEVAARRVGAGLVTVMRHHATEAEVERLYSSNEQAYPVGGRKQKRDTGWSRKVLERASRAGERGRRRHPRVRSTTTRSSSGSGCTPASTCPW